MATAGGIEPEPTGYEEALNKLANWIAAQIDGINEGLGSLRILSRPTRAAGVTALTAYVLAVAGVFLTSHSGYGLEDWLGWGSDARDSSGAALRSLWQALGLSDLARLDLSFDAWVFVPCYAALLTRLLWTLGVALRRDRDGPLGPRDPAPEWLLVPLIALVLADEAENILALLRLDAGWMDVMLMLPASLVVIALTDALTPILGRWRARAWLGGTALALLCIYAAGVVNAPACVGATEADFGWPAKFDLGAYGCASHHGKRWLMMGLALWLALLGATWLFAVFLRDDTHRAQDARATLRAAIGDMLLRSRYVLIALGLMALLCLAMDQARDVAYAALAAGARFSLWARGIAIALGAAGAWAFAFSCWLWTRSICEVTAAGRPLRDVPDLPDDFARYWARLLGMAPLLMCALLMLNVCRDAVAGAYASVALARPEEIGAALEVAGVAAAVSGAYGALALGFAWARGRHRQLKQCYYNARADLAWLFGHPHPGEKIELDARYSLIGQVPPLRLVALTLWGFFAARAFDLTGWLPSLAQAEISLVLAFWLCIFGWLSLRELRSAVPWVLALVLLVGLGGWLGLNGHHVVWSPLRNPAAQPGAGWDMLLASMSLALLVHLAYALVMRHARARVQTAVPLASPSRSRPGPGLQRWAGWLSNRWLLAGALFAVWLAALGAMAIADHQLGHRQEAATAAWVDPRPSLDEALAQWLTALCTERPACARNADDAELDVYLIATAGGGIRATAWTANLLQSWQEEDPQFAARTFAISGVSGGAVGAAVFRACQAGADPRAARQCIANFMQADLLSPLLSAWMFEDVLGTVLPSRVCRDQPACGFLSRAAWFEAGMERGAPQLRQELGLDHRGIRLPHLLLNSTWVETGERAIASDLRVPSTQFVGARDQLDILRHGLPLSTAAHNAARFPYTNALGELRSSAVDCLRRGPASASAVAGPAEPCGHLADGGYYDNSGMASLADVMQGLRKCLRGTSPACTGLSSLKWLGAHLRVHTLMLRNSPRLSDAPSDQCPGDALPTAAQVAPPAAASCVAREPLYQPRTPACAGTHKLYVDALGPPLAVVQGSGIGAHGRRDEALMFAASAELPGALSPVAVDLLQQGAHYPLGWHLSGAAAQSIAVQASVCRLSSLQSAPQR